MKVLRFVFLFILTCLILPASYAFAESDPISFFVVIQDGDKVVLQKEYILNPEFVSISGGMGEKFARELSQGYADRMVLDYLFFDMGQDVTSLFDDLDEVSEAECIDFDARTNSFSYHEERSGKRVIREDFLDAVLSALSKGRLDYRLRYQNIPPKFTRGELLSCTKKIGEFQTFYPYSTEGRKHNIALASRYLSGAVILPGEEFSFNERVGKRSEDRGFRSAKIIMDGEFTDGVGGGVCQVATTLYNAVLRAGLTVTECRRHTLAPSYVDLSFDAMVSEWSDLKIKNDTQTPIFISAFANGEEIKVTVFGRDDGRDRVFDTKVTEVIRHEEWYEGALEYKNGYKSEGYISVYESGRLLYREKIRSDHYKPYKLQPTLSTENGEQEDLSQSTNSAYFSRIFF